MYKLSRLFCIVCAVMILALVAGCGGGGSSSDGSSGAASGAHSRQTAASGEEMAADNSSSEPESKAEAKTRAEIKRIVDAQLPKYGISSDEIACVAENIATMTPKELAAGVTRPSGTETAERVR